MVGSGNHVISAMYCIGSMLHTVSFSMMPATPCIADVSNVSIELSRYLRHPFSESKPGDLRCSQT